jgi:predicted dehydrogenase
MKDLRIGLIGYGFMGKAHSNAYRRVPNFFNLEYQPVLKAVCGRDREKAQAFANQWGYESVETDWRKVIERKDIDAVTSARRTTRTRKLPWPRPRRER